MRFFPGAARFAALLCLSAVSPALSVASGVRPLDVRAVSATALTPPGAPAAYHSLTEAESAMAKAGVRRAAFDFSFDLPPALCGREDTGVYLGVIYDQDRVYLNGELIGITADPEHVQYRKTAKPRLYLMPRRLLRCGQSNAMRVDARSLVGRRLGPFVSDIRIGPWWELETYADRLQEYLLFFREVGFLILAVTLMLFSLFWKYSLNRRQMAFVAFAFWAGLMCVSLSGWAFSLIPHPFFLYALHAALVCVMMTEFVRLLAMYADHEILPGLRHFWSGSLSFLFFCGLFAYLPSVQMALVYRVLLLVYIVVSFSLVQYTIVLNGYTGMRAEAFLLGLVIVGVTSDTARILGLHSGQNISGYLIAVSVIGLGLLLARDLVGFFKMAADTQRINYERERAEVLGNMARQVAHDIRSPLSALDSVIKEISSLPEEKRLMLRSSVGRIRDIANELINKNRLLAEAPQGGSMPRSDEAASLQLLSALIEPVVTEKRLQFRSKIGVEIDLRLDINSYGLFSRVHPSEFKRAISNIMNNSVEAMENKGTVIVSVARKNGRVAVLVEDNGKGIPPEVIGRLGRCGESYGKSGGSGLGLYYAKTAVETWGGKLEIKSEIGKGTSVELLLTAAYPPEWFLPRLELERGARVVVFDDDSSIHQVWQGRFDSLRAKEMGVELLHFSTPKELREWVSSDIQTSRRAFYLLDYEIFGHPETGLDLAEELRLGDRAALVTSRYEEKRVLDHCRRLGMRMMPKGLAGLMPISIGGVGRGAVAETPAARRVVVLLDDDPLVHMNWRLAAKAAGAELKSYNNPLEFSAAAGTFPHDVTLYIDSDLGGDIKGEDIAKSLYEKGFTNITMATGHAPQKFSHLPWLKVTGKEPPWA